LAGSFYQAYREFFAAEVELHGAVESIEKWIFTPAVNLDQNGKGNPHMLARLMSLILHPFIRLGYGLEFDIPAMIVQGMQYSSGDAAPNDRFVDVVPNFQVSRRQLFIDRTWWDCSQIPSFPRRES